jgi:hypothetical protein
VKLKEMGILVEREWWIDDEGIAYVVDLALAVEDGWLPVTFGDGPVRLVGYTSMVRPSLRPAYG